MSNTDITNQQQDIILCEHEFVLVDTNGNMVTWNESDEIYITGEFEEDVKKEKDYTPVRCTELSEELKIKLIDNIRKYKYLRSDF